MSAAGSSSTAKRVIGRPWVKGQSGNPKGRALRSSADLEVQRLARAHTVPAVNALVRALKDPRTRVTAAMGLLAYGYGRPQQFEGSGGPNEEETVTFVLKIVGEPSAHGGLNGSNGATHRVITLPAPSNDNGNDDD